MTIEDDIAILQHDRATNPDFLTLAEMDAADAAWERIKSALALLPHLREAQSILAARNERYLSPQEDLALTVREGQWLRANDKLRRQEIP